MSAVVYETARAMSGTAIQIAIAAMAIALQLQQIAVAPFGRCNPFVSLKGLFARLRYASGGFERVSGIKPVSVGALFLKIGLVPDRRPCVFWNRAGQRLSVKSFTTSTSCEIV